MTDSTQCEAITSTESDVIRCTQDARPGGLCYYHAKMRRGLLQPATRVRDVHTVAGVKVYPAGEQR